MSKKSTGPHLLVPDEPVKEYSERLNSYYETLHLFYSSLLTIPDRISTIKSLLCESEKMFYVIRDLLEDDYGIHPYTAEILKVPECEQMLKQLVQWEGNLDTAKNEYLRRQNDEKDALKYNGEYISFWINVRYSLWYVERCLRIARERTIHNNDKYPSGKKPPLYPWIKNNSYGG